MSLEKDIAAALDPLLIELAELRKCIDEINARPPVVAIKGDKGDPGEPGAMPEVEVDVDAVTAALKADAEFLADVRGAPGADADDCAIADRVYKRLLEHGAAVDATAQQWAPGIYREGTIVQAHIGQLFKAACDTASEPGNGNDWQRIGNGGFRYCGVKRGDRDYTEGDIFIDDGTTFIVNAGKSRMLARRGRDAEPAKPGTHGTDAPRIVETKMLDGGAVLALAFDNGDVIECATPEIRDCVTNFAKALELIEQQQQRIEALEKATAPREQLRRRST